MYHWRVQPPLLRCYQVPSWQLGIESLTRVIEAGLVVGPSYGVHVLLNWPGLEEGMWATVNTKR